MPNRDQNKKIGKKKKTTGRKQRQCVEQEKTEKNLRPPETYWKRFLEQVLLLANF